MYPQFLPQFNRDQWTKRLEIFRSLQDGSEALFAGEWEDNSLWRNFYFLYGDLSDNLNNAHEDLRDPAYFYTLLSSLDYRLLEKMNGTISELKDFFVNFDSKNEVVTADPEALKEWHEIFSVLGISKKQSDAYWQKINSLNKKDSESILGLFKDLINYYSKLKISINLVSSAVLCHQAQDPITSFDDFIKIFVDLVGDPSTRDEDKWVSVFRFLGQSFYGRDSDTIGWATDFLMNYEVDVDLFNKEIDYILFLVILNLGFYEFSDNMLEVEKRMIEKNFWHALCFGVPIEEMLKKSLALQPVLTFYLANSFGLAESILKNEEPIFLSLTDDSNITVSGFVKKYLSFAGDKDVDGFKQVQYVETQIKENKWPAGLKHYLLLLLNTYIHLREADLVDYHGMLSEEGLAETPNWDAVLSRDLTEQDIVDIKKYFEIMPLPTRMKMELVVAFQKVDWKNEPYLSRALALDSLYSEVYNPRFTPLVYFDEKKGGWEFNKDLGDVWDWEKEQEPRITIIE